MHDSPRPRCPARRTGDRLRRETRLVESSRVKATLAWCRAIPSQICAEALGDRDMQVVEFHSPFRRRVVRLLEPELADIVLHALASNQVDYTALVFQ